MIKMFQRIFPPNEVKLALKELRGLREESACNSFLLVETRVEKLIVADPAKFAKMIQKGHPIPRWVMSATGNFAGDLLESGELHIYRGTLNPMQGIDILKLFDWTQDKSVQHGWITAEFAANNKRQLRENIADVG